MALPTPPSSSFHSAAQSPSSSPFTDPPSTVLVPPASPLSLGHSSMHPPCAFDAEASDDSSWSNAHGLCDIDPLLHSAKVRTCDVFVGYCDRCPSVTRFVKWLRAELEMQGFSCFLSDRSRLRDARSAAVVRTAMEAAAFGMVVVTRNSFSNPYSVEELRMFLDMRKLIPIFFGLAQSECMPRDIVERRGFLWERNGGQCWNCYGGIEKDWMEAVDGLSRVDLKLEATQDNMRDCILEIVRILGTTLGRTSTVERVRKWRELAPEEFMFPRNASFVGRKKELLELELLLFGEEDQLERSRGEYRRRIGNDSIGMIGERGVKISEDIARKGKEPLVWMESDDEIEFQGFGSGEGMVGSKPGGMQCGRGIALVTGESGIGKTELLLEFAYRFSQRYKMVLWVGGEARYLRRNYMKLLPLLGVDVDVAAQNELSLDRQGGRPKSFAEMEGEAIGKVRREMMRDIPFLLVIDNLEVEEDWWDGRNVMELLPRFGGETHVLISTRLPNAINVQPMRLLHLSAGEAMSLMRGTLGDLPIEDVDALRALEEKLDRLPLALALVGAILVEMPISPLKLLEKISRMPHREIAWNGKKEDPVLRRNPFLVKLLDFCFSFLNHAEKFKKLKPSIRMLHASSWLAPAPVPVSTLVQALMEAPEENHAIYLWKKCRRRFACMCIKPRAQSSEVELADMMVRLRISRGCTNVGCIYLHDIIKLYARKTDYSSIAHAIVQAINAGGSIQEHSEHAWAACFLVFKFSIDPSIVDLSVQDIVSFIKQIVLPLAMHDLKAFSQYTSVLELLRLATEKLEAMEDSFLSDNSSNKSAVQIAPNVYYEFAHLRATLLESRAKLMIRGGLYDTGEQLYRKALNIKEVICGWEHPETQATRQIMEKLISLQSNF